VAAARVSFNGSLDVDGGEAHAVTTNVEPMSVPNTKRIFIACIGRMCLGRTDTQRVTLRQNRF
jgi:hypothetical protein